jgi:hypothetical protein
MAWLDKVWRKIRETKNSNGIVAVCTAVIAAANILFFIVSYFQWTSLSEANRINRESVQAVQRAFVKWDSFSIQNYLMFGPKENTKYIQINSDWENGGSTPAIDVSAYFNIDELSNPPSGKIFMGTRVAAKTNVGPRGRLSQTNRKPIDFYTKGIELSTIRSTQPLDRNIFFWGWVVYRDVFPNTKPHLTEFCQLLVGISLVASSESKTTVIPKDFNKLHMNHNACEQHNCVDEYCPDYNEVIRFVTTQNR